MSNIIRLTMSNIIPLTVTYINFRKDMNIIPQLNVRRKCHLTNHILKLDLVCQQLLTTS